MRTFGIHGTHSVPYVTPKLHALGGNRSMRRLKRLLLVLYLLHPWSRTSCVHAVVRVFVVDLINTQLFFQVMDVLPTRCKCTVIHDVVL